MERRVWKPYLKKVNGNIFQSQGMVRTPKRKSSNVNLEKEFINWDIHRLLMIPGAYIPRGLLLSVYLEEPQAELWVSHTPAHLFTPSESITAGKFLVPSLPCYCPINRLWPADLSQPIRTLQNIFLFAFILNIPNCTIWKPHLHEMGWHRNYR